MKYSEKEMADAIDDLLSFINGVAQYGTEESKFFPFKQKFDELMVKHPVIKEIDNFGPDGPVGIGLGNFGGHAVG